MEAGKAEERRALGLGCGLVDGDPEYGLILLMIILSVFEDISHFLDPRTLVKYTGQGQVSTGPFFNVGNTTDQFSASNALDISVVKISIKT